MWTGWFHGESRDCFVLSSRSTNGCWRRLWSARYAPRDVKHICGNSSGLRKLTSWIANWSGPRLCLMRSPCSRSRRKKSFATGFTVAGPDGTGAYRAVLISGPSGVGKTLAAHLVAKAHGFVVVEYNSSSDRSASALNVRLCSQMWCIQF